MQKRIIKAALVLLTCFFVCAGTVSAVMAEGIDFSKIPDLTDYDLSPSEVTSKTQVFEEKPNGDKFLAYDLRLPTNWTKQDMGTGSGDTSKSILGDIGHFYGPPQFDPRSFVVIQATELAYEVTAKNWFLNYVLTHGYTLQGMRVLSSRRVEGMYILLQKDISYVVRAVGEINGSRMVLTMYYVPEYRWQAERAYQSEAIKSFHFLQPERARVETIRTYAFLDLLRFDYPASWRLQAPNILSVESMSAKIVNSSDDTIMNGQIEVNVVSTELDTTLPEQIKKVQKTLDSRGLLIGKLIEQPTDFKVHDNIYYSRIEMYDANDKEKELVDYEYWIAVLIENRYYYIVTMLTPSRTSDFFGWARNSEAFHTVVESLRP